jgi:hypothetical protein
VNTTIPGPTHTRWTCPACGASFPAEGKQRVAHATFERTRAFLDDLPEGLRAVGIPVNAVVINRKAEHAGVSPKSFAKGRARLVLDGVIVHDFYEALAAAHGMPSTLAHFWRLPEQAPWTDEGALRQMVDLLRGGAR